MRRIARFAENNVRGIEDAAGTNAESRVTLVSRRCVNLGRARGAEWTRRYLRARTRANCQGPPNRHFSPSLLSRAVLSVQQPAVEPRDLLISSPAQQLRIFERKSAG